MALVGALASFGFVFELEAIRIRDRYETGTEPERRNAIRSLRGLDGPVVRALLVEALEDTDSEVRLVAANGLVDRDVEAVIPVVAPWLEDAFEEPRCVAARAMGHFHVEQYRPRLERMLSDSDASVRRRTAEALAELGGSVAALTAALDDTDSSVKLVLLDALARAGDTVAAPAIARMVRDADPSVRRAALVALGLLVPEDAAASAIVCLDDPDADVVIAALARIAITHDAALVSRVEPMLEDRRVDVAVAATYLLARLHGSSEADPHVAALLAARLEDPRLAHAASRALASLDGSDAARVCIDAATPFAMGAATRSIALLTIRRCAERGSVDTTWSTESATTLASLVEREGDAESVPLLVTNPDESVTRVLTVLAVSGERGTSDAALLALTARLRVRGADGRVAEPLVLALDAFDAERRIHAIETLAASGAPRVAPALRRRFATTTRAGERAALLRTLGALGDDDSLPLALASTKSDDVLERDAAIDALSALADRADGERRTVTQRTIRGLAASADARERAAGIDALGRVANPSTADLASIERALDDVDPRVAASALDIAVHSAEPRLRDAVVSRAREGGFGARVALEWRELADTGCSASATYVRVLGAERAAFTRFVATLPTGRRVTVSSDARARLPRELTCARSIELAERAQASFEDAP